MGPLDLQLSRIPNENSSERHNAETVGDSALNRQAARARNFLKAHSFTKNVSIKLLKAICLCEAPFIAMEISFVVPAACPDT